MPKGVSVSSSYLSIPQLLHRALWFCRFKINPGNLSRGLVSCMGAQFCGSAGSRSIQETYQEVWSPVRALNSVEWRSSRPRTGPWLWWRSWNSSWTSLRLSESIGLGAPTPVARYGTKVFTSQSHLQKLKQKESFAFLSPAQFNIWPRVNL